MQFGLPQKKRRQISGVLRIIRVLSLQRHAVITFKTLVSVAYHCSECEYIGPVEAFPTVSVRDLPS